MHEKYDRSRRVNSHVAALVTRFDKQVLRGVHRVLPGQTAAAQVWLLLRGVWLAP